VRAERDEARIRCAEMAAQKSELIAIGTVIANDGHGQGHASREGI
jgi:hypothetical protein